MNLRKTAAFAAAVCILTGQAVYQPICSGAVYAEDTENIAGTATLKVGESVEVKQMSGDEKPLSWYSDDVKVATVSSDGKITAVGEGKTYIYAVLATSVQKFEIIVEKADGVPEETGKVIKLGTVSLRYFDDTAKINLENAPVEEFDWKSSDEKVAKVNENGEITACGKGECTLTAEYGGNTYIISVISYFFARELGNETVTLDDILLSDEVPQVQINIGEELLKDNIRPEYKSSDESVATIDNQGVITAVSSGEAEVTVRVGRIICVAKVRSTYTGKEQPMPVTDLGDVELTQANPDKMLGLTIEDYSETKWSSTDESVAAADGKGMVSATGYGECDIMFEYRNAQYVIHIKSAFKPASMLTADDCDVTVNGIGTVTQLSSKEKIIKWVSLNEDVAEIDENGKLTSKSAGIAVIKAYTENGAGSIAVRVAELSISGDADCDSQVKINDAVLVLQSISSADKFKLSEQGQKNADCYGNNDGITPMDALAIQKYLLGVYTYLPVEK